MLLNLVLVGQGRVWFAGSGALTHLHADAPLGSVKLTKDWVIGAVITRKGFCGIVILR